jgi:DNA-binding MarR family transcriptional regulator
LLDKLRRCLLATQPEEGSAPQAARIETCVTKEQLMERSTTPSIGSPLAGDRLYGTFARLVRVQTRLWNDVDVRVRTQHGVQLTDLTALEVVADIPGCRVQDLVHTLHITVGGASKVVDRLVAAGYLVRTANPIDRRSSVLCVTPPGMDLLEFVKPDIDEVLRERLALVLSQDDLAGLDRALVAIQEAFAAPQERA